MKQAQRILLAVVLVLTCFVVYQQKQDLDLLEHRVSCIAGTVERNVINFREIENELDLSVLDSCGIITDGQGMGSCVAIEPDLLLTAGHCMDINDTYIMIEGHRYEIINKWRSGQYDLEFVRIDPNGYPLTPLNLGQVPNILDTVYAVGRPYHRSLTNAITKGIVCKLHAAVFGTIWSDMMVIDADIGPGSSGGPVLDIEGNIIGICVAEITGSSIAFCVPVSHIRKALIHYRQGSDPI